MATAPTALFQRRFATALLPWVIAGAGLALYLVTLNHWVTLQSVGVVAQTAGWQWIPDLTRPLLYLVLAPFKLLPEALIPPALNVFNAVLAALVLALLARSVALLPHDRTADQRALEPDENGLLSGRLAWLPPALACAGIGLQISFWENATAMTGEMLDLLLIAYVIRSLLEFRVDGRHRWIYRAAFLYAAGMTNNWALVGLAPVFLVAILWIKGISFFHGQFIARLIGWGLAGLVFYLVLPVIQSFADVGRIPFWDALREQLLAQKRALGATWGFFKDNYRVVVLAAPSLLPLAFIALRWRSSFGDNSPLGILITKFIFHLVHALFLGVGLLVLFSPPWSPRQIVPGMPFLLHYYLCALTAGYCAGYFLVIGRAAFAGRRVKPIVKMAGLTALAAPVLLLLIVPPALLARNWALIQLNNRRLLEDYARRTAEHIPAAPAMVLSDDPRLLAVMRAYLVRTGEAKNTLFYDTRLAGMTDYHRAQVRQQPGWPATFAGFTNNVQIRPLYLIGFLLEQSQTRSLCYLQPSFGYYFERFNLQPRGTAYPLAVASTNDFRNPRPGAEVVALNEQFWAGFDTEARPALERGLVDEDAPITPAWKAKLYGKLHLTAERNYTAEALAGVYSRAATHWAVEMQKLGQWEAAAAHLRRALDLFPANIAAEMNLEFNETHRAGKPAPGAISKSIEDRFGRYPDWNAVINNCGPFDDPRFTFEQARVFLQGGNYRQALHHFLRAAELEPTSLTARLWLADVWIQLNRPAEALALVADLRTRAAQFGLNPTNEHQVVRVEAAARFRAGETDAARGLLERALARPGAPDELRLAATQLYLQHGLFAEAVAQFDQALAKDPKDVLSHANRGYACLQLNRTADALQSLDRALELDSRNNVVRLNRAIARYRAGRYAEARADYEELLAASPDAFQAHFGLGEVALALQDNAEALKHYERYLRTAPRQTAEYLQVSNRVVELRARR